MCVQKIRRQVSLSVWRIYLVLTRQKMKVCCPLFGWTAAIIGVVLQVTVFGDYVKPTGAQTNTDMMYTVEFPAKGPNVTNGVAFAQACRDLRAATIGLIDPPGQTFSPQDSPSQKIYNRLQQYFNEDDRGFFRPENFTDQSLEYRDKELKMPGFQSLDYVPCFAIKVLNYEKGNESTKPKFEIDIKMMPQLIWDWPSDLTLYKDLNTYNHEFFNATKNTGYHQIYAAVTDAVIREYESSERNQKFRDYDQVYPQLNILPSAANSRDYSPNYLLICQFWQAFLTHLCMCAIPIYEGYLNPENRLDVTSYANVLGFKHISRIQAQIVLSFVVSYPWSLATWIILKYVVAPNASITLLAAICFVQWAAKTASQVFWWNFLEKHHVTANLLTFTFPLLGGVMALIGQAQMATQPPQMIMAVGIVFPTFQDVLELSFYMEFLPERSDRGLRWTNLNFQNRIDRHSIMDPFLKLNAISFGVYTLLCLILLPKFYINDGKKRGLFWCCPKKFKQIVHGEDLMEVLMADEKALVKQGLLEMPNVTDKIQTDPGYMNECLRVLNLDHMRANIVPQTRKEMPKRRVISDFTLTFLRDQVTVIIGHKGSGKSTLLKLLAGHNNVYPDLDGPMFMAYGIDIIHQREEARELIGFSPEEDSLIGEMTVEENIFYFLGIKGLSADYIEDYAKHALVELHLKKKKLELVATLSQAQKQKLQLLIAFAGDKTKLILLDEPTRNMNKVARRETLDFIKKRQEDRIVIVTTELLQVAEAIGDRIALMSRGKMKICGSAQFIRDYYRLGMNLEVTPLNRDLPMDDLESFIQQFVDEQSAKIEEERSMNFGGKQPKDIATIRLVSAKLNMDDGLYRINLPRQLSANFETIFGELDNPDNAQRFNMETYNVRYTSLDEKFQRLREIEMAEEENPENEDELIDKQITEHISQLPELPSYTKQTPSGCKQFCLLLNSFFLNGWRNFEVPRLILTVGFFTFMTRNSANFDHAGQADYVVQVLDAGSVYSNDSAFTHFNLLRPEKEPFDNKMKLLELMDQKAFNQSSIWRTEVPTPKSITKDRSMIDNIVDWQNQTMNDSAYIYLDNQLDYLKEMDPRGLLKKQAQVQAGVLFMGPEQVETVGGQKQLNVPIYLSVNDSQAYSVLALPSMVQSSFANVIVGKDVGLKVTWSPLKNQALFAQAWLPAWQAFTRLGPFTQVSLATLISINLIIEFRKQNGVEQMIVMAGVSRFSYVAAIFVSQIGKLLFVSIGVGMVLAWLSDMNLTGLPVAFIAAGIHQAVYLAYRCTLSYEDILRKSRKEFIWSLGSLLFPEFMAFFFINSSFNQVTPFIWALEVVLCMHPKMTMNIMYLKFLYRARFAIQNNSSDTGPFYWHSVLPEFIGMGLGTLFWGFFAMRNLYMMTPAKLDNMLQRIDSKKDLSVQMKEIKTDLESTAKTMDKTVKDEAVKAKNIIAGIQAAETITVSDLQKYYITTPEGQNVDETEQEKRFEKRQKIEGKQEIRRAIDGISFSVKENETLAILGVEGTGKSSIFNCLTTNLKMSWGNIHYGKTDVADCLQHPNLLQNLLGFCPQENVCVQRMFTVKEQIQFYCTLAGIPDEIMDCYIKLYATKFELVKYLDKKASLLSEGNQRKLNTLTAFIGNPSAILLDEAFEKMDPFTRRRLWKHVKEEQIGSAMILTTKSAEEAEALATKIAIMVDGQFKCLGTADQIKEKYGKSFTVTVKVDLDRLDGKTSGAKKTATMDIMALKKSQTKADTKTPNFALDRSDSRSESTNSIHEDPDNDVRQSLMDTTSQASRATVIKITLEEVVRNIKRWMPADGARVALDFENELSEEGLLSGYYKQLKEKQPIDVQSLFETVLILNEVALIMTYFDEDFGCTSIVDYYNDKVTYSIDNQRGQSIGQLFTFIESVKLEMCIKDYSAENTSLQTIMTQFTKQEQMTKINNRLRRHSSVASRARRESVRLMEEM